MENEGLPQTLGLTKRLQNRIIAMRVESVKPHAPRQFSHDGEQDELTLPVLF